jgi:hypothetical protein
MQVSSEQKVSPAKEAATAADQMRRAEPRLQRNYPDHFTAERPLRVLFLGLERFK